MRKNGWNLPYHPLQVVAVAVFVALAFAFYVFFAPFVGKKLYQYIAMGIYTPLILCVFGLYIWCAAADPADPGVFKSKKYLKFKGQGKPAQSKDSKMGTESASSIHGANVEKSIDKGETAMDTASKDLPTECEKASTNQPLCYLGQLVLSPCACLCRCCMSSKDHSEQKMSEDGMFYCSLCEVEVFKYSKHCRVCDKCVDCFDHHCRWLNNCIGKRNYRQFFTLMIFSILLLIIQWAIGILVLVCCFLEHKRFKLDISTKLGSSFTLVPYVIVVVVCTILAMIATLPLAQLFFFHILLIKKGISTYDYIIALREQELDQQGPGGQQSPQMSPASSLTGLSSASSFSTFRRGAWCTPPRLFLEDQFDVVPPETASVSSMGKKSVADEPVKKKNPAAVKISPWTLARLNAEEISKVAAEARKKSKILQPVVRQDRQFGLERDNSFDSSGRRMVPRIDSSKRRANKRVRLPAELPMESLAKNPAKITNKCFTESSSSLAPLQFEALSAFRTSQAMSSSFGVVASSPESSLDSPDIHPFRLSSEAEDARRLTGLPPVGAMSKGIPFSRSTSDGYEASGGEDSDRVPSRIVQRPTDWSNLLSHSDKTESIIKLKAPPSSGLPNHRRL